MMHRVTRFSEAPSTFNSSVDGEFELTTYSLYDDRTPWAR
jgi:hypothetical protein